MKNKILFKLTTVAVTSFTPIFTWAQQTPTQLPKIGGHVVVCKNLSGLTVEPTEYFLARQEGKTISVGPASAGVDSLVRELLHRFRVRSPGREKWLLKKFQKMSTVLRIEPDINFGGSETLKISSLPANCTVEQAAIQQNPTKLYPFSYLIRKGLWDAMDNVGKAGLLVHQLLLNEMLEYKDPRSDGVRNLNQQLATDEISQFKNAREWVGFLHNQGFRTTDICGVRALADGDPFFFDDKGNSIRGWVTFDYNGDDFREGRYSSRDADDYTFPNGLTISNGFYDCYPSGGLKSISYQDNFSYHFQGHSLSHMSLTFDEAGNLRSLWKNDPGGVPFEIFGQVVKGYTVSFSSSGRVLTIDPDGSGPDSVFVGSVKVLVSPRGHLEAYESGEPLRLTIIEPASLPDTSGTTRVYPADSDLIFDRQGRVVVSSN